MPCHAHSGPFPLTFWTKYDSCNTSKLWKCFYSLRYPDYMVNFSRNSFIVMALIFGICCGASGSRWTIWQRVGPSSEICPSYDCPHSSSKRQYRAWRHTSYTGCYRAVNVHSVSFASWWIHSRLPYSVSLAEFKSARENPKTMWTE